MENPSYVDLPSEIIMEILLRLPVKILLRFKCVCKNWYTLIGSPSFINLHFGHESNSETLLIWHLKPLPWIFYFVFGFYVDEMYSVHNEEPDPLQSLGEAEMLMGPSNGVICVCSRNKPGKKMALLNPAMRQFKPLPLLHRRNLESHLFIYSSSLGFGLDPVSGDYKVVSIQHLWNRETNVPHHPPIVNVYDSGSNSWRGLEDVDLVSSMHCMCWSTPYGTYLDGVCYWQPNFYDSDAIIAFDMRIEKFRKIKVPDYIISPNRRFTLTLNGDSLALLSAAFSAQTGRSVDVWVMQDERSWAKILTLSSLGKIRPFGFWKKNELILGGLSTIFALDGSKEKLWSVETPVRRTSDILFHAYKESLVSIKREGDNCMLWDTSSDFVKDFFR